MMVCKEQEQRNAPRCQRAWNGWLPLDAAPVATNTRTRLDPFCEWSSEENGEQGLWIRFSPVHHIVRCADPHVDAPLHRGVM